MADPTPLVSVPAMSNWAGDYNFKVSFSSEGQLFRKVVHTYSTSLNKLYILKDVAFPINISTEQNMPPGTVIRALAVFSLPDETCEVVRRCVSHSLSDIAMGVQHPHHVVRCESNRACYEESPTGHLSVCIPFENPQSGESYSTYLFKFVCFGSCTGGINRRPIALVLTLENCGQVLGRHSVNVRICACPARDRRSDEKHFEPKLVQNPQPRKRSSKEQGSILEIMQFAQGIKLPSKKIKIPPRTPEGDFVIPVTSPGMYTFLKQMEVFYKICNSMKNIPPHLQRALSGHSHTSSEDKKNSEDSN